MAIEQIKDPRTHQNTTFISGKIDGVFFNELKTVKTYTGGKAPWTPTHSSSIVVDGVRVNMGLTEKDAINSKDISGNYHKLAKGMEVSVEVSKIGEYNGNPTYDSKASFITVLDVSGIVNEPQSGVSKAPYKKKDNKGIVAGNSRTAAANWVSRFEGDIVSYLELFANLADDKRKSYAAGNPNLDDFEVGVTVGQAVIAASQISIYEESLGEFVDYYLNTVVPKSLTIIENLQANTSTQTEAKKEVKKATPSQTSPDLGDLDDIPF